MTSSEQQQREFDRFPPELRELVAAELAAGNRIVDIASTFPAPPAGAWLMLERAVTTRPRESGGGIGFYDRNGSSHSGEFHDARQFWFVLEPPHPEPPPPDMDEIRRALDEKSEDHPPQPLSSPPFTLEVDYRGDMLIYREENRQTDVICGFGGDPCILGRTLSNWWYPAEKRSERMSEGEKSVILQRIADHCQFRLGMSGIHFEGT